MDGNILLMIRTDVFPEIEAAWNKWYQESHIPARLSTPGFLNVCRLVSIERGPKYLTLFGLSNLDVLGSEAYRKVREREGLLPLDSFEAISARLPNLSVSLFRQTYPERKKYQPPERDFLFGLGHYVPSSMVKEFDRWFGVEFVGELRLLPGVFTTRLMMAVDEKQTAPAQGRESTLKYVALFDLEDEKVTGSAAFLSILAGYRNRWLEKWGYPSYQIIARRI